MSDEVNLFGDEPELTPIISLWRPWANWVALEWKTIESRLHNRFASLAGRRIGIHASLKWDKDWRTHAGLFLTPRQIAQTERFLNVGGAVICTVLAERHRPLNAEDSPAALINCADVKRFGLTLRDRKIIEAVPMTGRQGIWHAKL